MTNLNKILVRFLEEITIKECTAMQNHCKIFTKTQLSLENSHLANKGIRYAEKIINYYFAEKCLSFFANRTSRAFYLSL